MAKHKKKKLNDSLAMQEQGDNPVQTIQKTSRKKRLVVFGILLIVLSVASISAVAYYYSTRVGPNIYAAGVHLTGMTLSEATNAVQARANQAGDWVIKLEANNKTKEIHAADIGLAIDANATSHEAYAIGRRDLLQNSLVDMVRQIVKKTDVGFSYSYDQDKLDKIVADFAGIADQPEVNAGVRVDNGKAVETQGVVGHRITQAEVKNAILNHWKLGLGGELAFNLITVQPTIKSGDTAEVLNQAERLRKTKFVLTNASDQFSPKQNVYDSWISSEIDSGKLLVALNKENAKKWLDSISSSINQDAGEPRLSMNNGKVEVAKAGVEGKTLDVEKTADLMADAIRNFVKSGSTEKTVTSTVAISVSKPVVNGDALNSLGIKELVGTATTNYGTSPDNRKHNIATGASALNGIVLKPGEEFSTLKFLGTIDGTSGYLPELVIKVDKTVPEFGGGLCQVSTTLFRAALNSGLPITERQNHRYRVSYYEPPVGMDATIYEGSPDLKFVNDTSSYILIQSHADGSKITFEFYGTKDGRKVSISDPNVYNITTPPDPEYTQTDTLPEGTTKRTESAHNGADASFNYLVTNSDGSTRTKTTFTSHYTPWQAKYLVGTAKVDQPAESPTP